MLQASKTLRMMIVSLFSVFILNACDGNPLDKSGMVESELVSIDRIEISTQTPTIPEGAKVRFDVVAIYENGEKKDITNDIEWTSAKPTVASFDEGGVFLARSVGVTSITASYHSFNASFDLTVRHAELISIETDTSKLQLPVGLEREMVVTGVYTDNSKIELYGVQWHSSDDSIVSVNDNNVVGHKVGTAMLSAKVPGVAELLVTVEITSAVAQSMQIKASQLETPVGTAFDVYAKVQFSDGSTQQLGQAVSWNIDNNYLVEFTAAQGLQSFKTKKEGSTRIVANYMGLSAEIDLTITSPQIQALTIESLHQSIPKGRVESLRAFALYSDSSKIDVTNLAQWISGNADALIVSNAVGYSGKIYANAKGKAVITASFKGMKSQTEFTISAAVVDRLDIYTSSTKIPAGVQTYAFANGLLSDGAWVDLTKEVTWSLGSSDLAQIDNGVTSAGLINTVKAGNLVVNAKYNELSSITELQISDAVLSKLEIFSPSLTIAKGTSLNLKATGVYSDGSKQDLTSIVDWVSLNEPVAAFNQTQVNKLVSQQSGSVDVKINYGGLSAQKTILVVETILVGLTIDADKTKIASGLTMQMRATGIFSDGSKQDLSSVVSWQTSNTLLATIINSETDAGQLHALAPGTLDISASYQGKQATQAIEILAAQLKKIQIQSKAAVFAKGMEAKLSAMGFFSDDSIVDVSQQVSWFSSDNSKAIVVINDGKVVVKALDIGSVRIYAQYGDITANFDIEINQTVVTAVEISPQNAVIHAGLDMQLSAIAVLSDGSTIDITSDAIWQSNTPNISVISNAGIDSGLAQAVSAGTAIITATYHDKTDTSYVTINDALLQEINISPGIVTLASGNEIQLNATGLYSDGSRQDLTQNVVWSIDRSDLGEIGNGRGNEGILRAILPGAVIVTASLGNVSTDLSVNFSDAILQSISIDSETTSFPKGTSQLLSATGNYSDGSTRDLSGEVYWSSSDTQILEFEIASAKVIAKGVGTTSVTASFAGASGSFFLEVTEASLQDVKLSPANPTIANLTGLQMEVTGIFSDASEKNITDQVVWNSSNSDIAVVNNTPGIKGWVDAISPGTTTINFQYGNFSGTTNFTVSDATLESIEIISGIDSFAKNTQLQLHAIGHYSGNQQQDLTRFVNWSIDDETILTVDRSLQNIGMASGLSAGTANVQIDFNGLSATKALTVVDQVDMPVGMAYVPVPNVILNNNQDKAAVILLVRAADPQQIVPDNTTIDIEILEGTANLDTVQVTTTNGKAQFGLTSDYDGIVKLRASIAGTLISRTIYIYSSTSLLQTLSSAVVSKYVFDGENLLKNSLIGLALANVSTRPYLVLEFSISNAGVLLGGTTAPELLNNNKLWPGNIVNVMYGLDNDLIAPQFELKYRLLDLFTETEFTYSVTVTPTPPVLP